MNQTQLVAPLPIMEKSKRLRPSSDEHIAATAERCMWNEFDAPGTYLPSPDVIAAECAEIRAGWSEEEHRYRAALLPWQDKPAGQVRRNGNRRWAVPVVSLGERTVGQ